MSNLSLPAIAFLAVLSGSVAAQDISKPLTQGELLKTIDSIGIGDPLKTAPLSIDDDKKPDAPPAKKEKGPTEITALEASFDNKEHKAIFIGDVVVNDPEFNVKCDKLTAFLKHDDKPEPVKAAVTPGVKAATTPVKKPATPAPGKKPGPNDPPSKGGGGLEKAIAEMKPGGQVLITQDKVEADGTVSHNIGRGRKAVYDAITGDITLTGMPTVQQGINTCIALQEDTVMVLNREGRMHVTGPHKTIIKDTNSADSKTTPK